MRISHFNFSLRDERRRDYMARWINVDFFSQQTVSMSETLVGVKIDNSNRFISLLYRLLIAQIRRTDNKIPAVCVTAADVAAFMQVTPARATMGLRELLKQLETKDVPYMIFDNGMHIDIVNLFEYVTEIDHGIYEIQISQSLAPFLCNLQRRFLSYPLMNCIAIKSPNLLRLYEVLLHKKNKCEGKKLFFQLEITELRRILDAEDTYKTFAQLKTVIMRLINVFKELGNIVELSVFRKAKKAISVTFRFVSKASLKLIKSRDESEKCTELTEVDKEEEIFRDMLIKHGALVYFSKKQIKWMAKEIDFLKRKKEIEEILIRVLDQNEVKKIRKLPNYFIKCVKNELLEGKDSVNSFSKFSKLSPREKKLFEELEQMDEEWLFRKT